MADFTTLDELRRIITRYPRGGDGVVRDVDSRFEVRGSRCISTSCRCRRQKCRSVARCPGILMLRR